MIGKDGEIVVSVSEKNRLMENEALTSNVMPSESKFISVPGPEITKVPASPKIFSTEDPVRHLVKMFPDASSDEIMVFLLVSVLGPDAADRR